MHMLHVTHLLHILYWTKIWTPAYYEIHQKSYERYIFHVMAYIFELFPFHFCSVTNISTKICWNLIAFVIFIEAVFAFIFGDITTILGSDALTSTSCSFKGLNLHRPRYTGGIKFKCKKSVSAFSNQSKSSCDVLKFRFFALKFEF